MLERNYQKQLISKIYNRFPECLILKNDETYKQGIPDLVVFYKDTYFFLEVKTSRNAHLRPNQEYWVSRLNSMGHACFIYPEIEEEVLNEMERAFTLRR